jgi:hypothetical protein
MPLLPFLMPRTLQLPSLTQLDADTATFFNTENAIGHYCCLFLTQGRHLTLLLPIFNAQQRYSCLFLRHWMLIQLIPFLLMLRKPLDAPADFFHDKNTIGRYSCSTLQLREI